MGWEEGVAATVWPADFRVVKVYRALGSRLTNPFLWKGSCCPSTFKGSLFTEAPSYSVRVSLW